MFCGIFTEKNSLKKLNCNYDIMDTISFFILFIFSIVLFIVSNFSSLSIVLLHNTSTTVVFLSKLCEVLIMNSLYGKFG